MTKRRRRTTRGSLLPHMALVLVLMAATAVMGSGCQGLGGAAPDGQDSAVSADALGDEPSGTDAPSEVAEAEPTVEPIASPSSTPSPATRPASTPASQRTTAPTVGALAPDLTLPNLNGDEVTLSGLRGKPVLLNFWTSW